MILLSKSHKIRTRQLIVRRCRNRDIDSSLAVSFLGRSFGLPCLATDNCQTTLFCNHNTCQCAAGEYWNGSLCSKRKPLDGSCMLDTECEISLRCLSNRCQYCPFECSGVLSQADGVYTICPRGSHKQTTAYCITRGDKTWTVIQRRTEGLVDFYTSWI